jgi:hypothetical protein
MQLHHVLDAAGGKEWLGKVRNVIIGGGGLDLLLERRLDGMDNRV